MFAVLYIYVCCILYWTALHSHIYALCTMHYVLCTMHYALHSTYPDSHSFVPNLFVGVTSHPESPVSHLSYSSILCCICTLNIQLLESSEFTILTLYNPAHQYVWLDGLQLAEQSLENGPFNSLHMGPTTLYMGPTFNSLYM